MPNSSESAVLRLRSLYPCRFDPQLETLEPRLLFTAVPLITEFVASNSDGLEDEDGNSSDWIELYNAGDTALDLDGWHLTDDAGDLNQWAFPAVSLDPGQYLVVFASGKDRADADGTELHTNFSLGKNGEYLALVEADGVTVAHEYAPEFPAQEVDVSYGVDMSSSTQTIIESGAPLSYLVPPNGNLGLTWTEAGFNDNAWATGNAAFGIEPNPGDPVNYSALLNTTLSSGTTSAYTRFEFNLANPGAFSGLDLRVMYDDGFVAYLNGEFLTSHNAPGSPQWNSSAAGTRGDAVVIEDFISFDISEDRDALVAGNNVLAIQLLNTTSGSDMLLDVQLVGAVGAVTEPIETGYFQTPTPGAANGEAFDGFVADTTFSHDRGFYDAAFNLDITSATPDALIVYTTDGSAPTVDANLNITNGTEFTGAFQVSATTTVRAAAFKLGFEPTNVDTHTYLFLADVLTQSPTGTAPAGFPQGPVNGQVFDYGMDPDIVNDPTWGPQLTAALTDIPTISLVTEADHLFDSGTGIYVNAGNRGRAWERPTSIEMINGDGTTAFQTDAGLRIRGGFSRGDFNPKHSFRLFFRGEYGDAMLNFPMFGPDGADAFDAFDLRTAQNYAWSNDTFNNENHNTFLRDIFSRDIQGAMGHAHTRGDYYHLYLNGVYWGLYQTEERPEADFASSYFGGTDETWDAVKASGGNIEATDGDLSAWATLSTLTNNGFTNNADYFAIQGLNPDGTENPALEKHLDIDNLIDFMISVNFTANRDMPLNLGNSGPNNFWAIRPQDGSHGWRWIAHDNEHNMGAGDHNVNHNGTGDISTGTSTSTLNPRYIHQQLTENAEYRLRFADRVQALFFNDGPLTVANTQAMLDARAAQMDLAIIAESARWGDQHNNPPKTKTTWLAEVDWLRNTFLAQRGAVVLQQFRDQGWLPSTSHDAPSFSQHGGLIPPGSTLTITNNEAAGTVYYTTDGSDPRLPGGGLSAQAIEYTGPFELPQPVQTIRARLLRSGDWSAEVSAVFANGLPTPEQEYLRITELHYNPTGPTTAEQNAGFVDGDQFEFIELLNTSATETLDLSGVTFGNGIRDVTFVGPTQTVFDAGFDTNNDGFAFTINPFNGTTQTGVAGGTQEPGSGNGGGGALRIDLLSSDASPAFGPASAAFTRDFTLAEAGEVTIELDYRFFYGGGFESNEIGQAIAEVDGIRLGSALNGALVSLTGDGNAGPPTDTGWQTIFVTLQLGAGTHTLSLGAYYSQSTFDNENVTAWYDNVNLTFSAAGPLPLAPGERALLVSDLAAFTQRYGQAVVDNAAAVVEYAGNLANGGEAVKLNDANGSTILDFTYEDGDDPGEEDWPATPDGDGPSLVVLDTEGDYNDGNNWAASTTTHGTPGTGEAAGLVGDINADGYVDGLDLDLLFGFWGDAAASSPAADAADLNNDGTVNGPDLSLLLANFGTGTPPGNEATSNGDPGSDTPDAPDVDAGDGGGDAGDAGAGADPGMGEGVGAGGGDAGAGEGLDAGDGAGPDAGADDVGAPDNMPDTPDADRPRTPDFPGKSDPPAPDKPKPIDGLGPARHKRNAPDALALTRPITGQTTPDPKATPDTRPPRRFDALKMR